MTATPPTDRSHCSRQIDSQRGSIGIIFAFLGIWILAFEGRSAGQGVGYAGGIQTPATRGARRTLVSFTQAREWPCSLDSTSTRALLSRY